MWFGKNDGKWDDSPLDTVRPKREPEPPDPMVPLLEALWEAPEAVEFPDAPRTAEDYPTATAAPQEGFEARVEGYEDRMWTEQVITAVVVRPKHTDLWEWESDEQIIQRVRAALEPYRHEVVARVERRPDKLVTVTAPRRIMHHLELEHPDLFPGTARSAQMRQVVGQIDLG
jgi:hypothetical protein